MSESSSSSSSSSSSTGTPKEMFDQADAAGVDIENDQEMEMNWAIKAFKHAEVYWSLLEAFPSTQELRLTKNDDIIYEAFRETFPELSVDVIDEDAIKSKEGKELWRPFLMQFEKTVEDFNFLTLIRIDATNPAGYSEENTTVMPRCQFYCFEIARNREGVNDKLK
eukprot:TRINITY_DN7195_c0_g1_i1.p1 TRINITY_DN7195_c0_g1~~TRINITY_DN7195_c0_g1_i1.p1  ORF type:complete len:166 (-),score=70.31 TRINITY_DN7195_c0_g1_i1:16-513(-)